MSAKAVLRRSLPAQLVRIGSAGLDRTVPARRRNLKRARDHERWKRRTARLADKLVRRYGPVVQSGPFTGLRLSTATAWEGSLAPLLVGSYEAELHEWLEELIACEPARVVNVGCAEGYYAVGLARRLPEASIHAFDIDERAQLVASETARMNGVGDRVHISGACTPRDLEGLLVQGTLVLMDCEGCELDLLDPAQSPSLRQATILVELHDFVHPNVSQLLPARFAGSHSLRTIRATARVPADFAALHRFKPRERELAVDERRPTTPKPMEWALLQPRQKLSPRGRT